MVARVLAVLSRDFAPAVIESLVLSDLVVTIASQKELPSKNYSQKDRMAKRKSKNLIRYNRRMDWYL
jgi:hypothetical protein